MQLMSVIYSHSAIICFSFQFSPVIVIVRVRGDEAGDAATVPCNCPAPVLRGRGGAGLLPEFLLRAKKIPASDAISMHGCSRSEFEAPYLTDSGPLVGYNRLWPSP